MPISKPFARFRSHPKRMDGERGVVLIEVLVALLIFMIGILGFIGLQTALTKAQTEADLRASAAYLTSDIMARMWADMGNLNAYASSVGTPCTAAPCVQWLAKLAQDLPGGSAQITTDAATGDVTVNLAWVLPGGLAFRYETQGNVSAKSAL